MHIILGMAMGFMGSIHCIGMCGPLVMSLHGRGGGVRSNAFYQLAYHIGKICSYMVIGVQFGILGQTFHFFLSQQKLSLVIGISFILFFLFSKITSSKLSNSLTAKFLPITRFFNHIVVEKSILKMFLTGIGNGFLPCGFVYTAASASIATGKIEDSVLFMAGFGFGTIPALTGVIYLFHLVPERIKSSCNFIYRYLLIILGVLLILRGLNLGIPYISPAYNVETEEVHGCCHKESQ